MHSLEIVSVSFLNVHCMIILFNAIDCNCQALGNLCLNHNEVGFSRVLAKALVLLEAVTV